LPTGLKKRKKLRVKFTLRLNLRGYADAFWGNLFAMIAADIFDFSNLGPSNSLMRIYFALLFDHHLFCIFFLSLVLLYRSKKSEPKKSINSTAPKLRFQFGIGGLPQSV